MYLTLIIIVFTFLVWLGAIILLDRKGLLDKVGLTRWGISLMWKTEKGRGLIDKLARPKKFWIKVMNVGTYFFFLAMLIMFAMLTLSAYYSITSPSVKPVSVKEVLVLPGINPYVPFVYGIIALVVAVVFHEFAHGILARVGGFDVKSLGILFIIIPVGAFMEPDEEQVSKGSRLKRMRMFTSGPIMNFILAFLFITMFSWGFMASLEAEDDPLIITDISTDSPLYLSMEGNIQALYMIEDQEIHNGLDIYEIDNIAPGTWMNVTIRIDDNKVEFPTLSGLMITSITKDSPAEDVDLKIGSIILSLNGIPIESGRDLSDILEKTNAGEVAIVEVIEPVFENGTIKIGWTPPMGFLDTYNEEKIILPEMVFRSYNLTLSDKSDFYGLKQFENKGFIGIGTNYLGLNGVGSSAFIDKLSRPIMSADDPREKFLNVMYITFALPLEINKMPFHEPLTEIYEVTGPLSLLPDPIFWFSANLIFYLFWLNILLGLFNTLPAVPLDGGVVFRDGIVSFLYNFSGKKDVEKLEKIAKRCSAVASIAVLLLLLIIFFGPYIKMMFTG